jgi:protein-S-isoprenylcysteine O-methyltransferase Ste14
MERRCGALGVIMSRANGFVVGQFALFALFAAALVLLPIEGGGIAVLVGAALVLSAFMLLGFGVIEHLRRNASLPMMAPTPNARVGLVETGLYRYIRHPLYTGVLLAGFGTAIAHGHVLMLGLALVLTGFFTIKARYEESLLRRAYPQYAAYMKRTGRFLPGLNIP